MLVRVEAVSFVVAHFVGRETNLLALGGLASRNLKMGVFVSGALKQAFVGTDLKPIAMKITS